jgi:hypothetical protein
VGGAGQARLTVAAFHLRTPLRVQGFLLHCLCSCSGWRPLACIAAPGPTRAPPVSGPPSPPGFGARV